ncbi:MAG TPA: GNAT family N-acetyltransferase [Bacillales bacterium]|nr:GNAT family N-acetyltransferase [Bacillales bacterium]
MEDAAVKIYELTQEADREVREKVANLFLQQISMHGEKDAHEVVRSGIDQALEDVNHTRIVVAEDDGEMLGLALINIGISLRDGGKYIWLNELYVHNDYRNQGIGRKLLLHIIYWAENEQIKTIELETGVSNSVTKHLYNSLGFYDVVSKRYGFRF